MWIEFLVTVNAGMSICPYGPEVPAPIIPASSPRGYVIDLQWLDFPGVPVSPSLLLHYLPGPALVDDLYQTG